MAAVLAGKSKIGEFAERSGAVYSANWKEDILLQKKLNVLKRSEKGVVHRIKVDQKVMFKRFQAKLLRSKLSHAQIVGDKNRERELRSHSLNGLNTDGMVATDEEYAFLDKLETRPCIVDKATKSNSKAKPPKSVPKILESILKAEEVKDKVQQESVKFGRSVSMETIETPKLLSKKSQTRETIRPATTSGARVGEEVVCNESVGQEVDDMFHDNLLFTPSRRPKTVSAKLEEGGSRLSSKQTSRRASRVTQKSSSSFFDDNKKVDLVELRLMEAKSKDFSTRVQDFCDSVNEFTSGNTSDFDYYTMRLQASLRNGQNRSLIRVPGTPEEENKRAVGNIYVRSLTTKQLNFNFDEA